MLSNIANIDNRCQYRLLSENNSPPPPRAFPFCATFAPCDLPLGSCDCFLFFYNLWSFWSWLPWKFCRKSLRVFTKERKNPWNVHSWPKLKIRNSSHFFRPYNKCLRNKSTGERTWNPRLQVKTSVQAIDTRAVRGNKSAKQRGSKFTYHSWSKPSYNSRAQCFVRWLIALKSPQSFRNSLKNVTYEHTVNKHDVLFARNFYLKYEMPQENDQWRHHVNWHYRVTNHKN